MPWIDATERLPIIDMEVYAEVDVFLDGIRKAIAVRKTESHIFCFGSNFFFTEGVSKLLKWWEDE